MFSYRNQELNPKICVLLNKTWYVTTPTTSFSGNVGVNLVRMKLHILILGLFICQFVVGQVDRDLLHGDWIAVEYRQNDSIDNEVLFGLILNFNEQGLEYFSLWDDSTMFLSYDELDSLEKISNLNFIQFANLDSLIIGDSSYSIIYYPMKSSISKVTKEKFDQLLIDKTWKLDDTTFTNIKFVNYLPSDFLPKRLDTYLVSDKNGFFQFADYWLTFSYKDNLFLAFSLYDNFNIYHIIDTQGEEVKFHCYSKNSVISFKFDSEKKLDETEYSDLKRIISSMPWKSAEKILDQDFYPDTYWGLYHFSDSGKTEILPNIVKHSEHYPSFIKYSLFNTSFIFNSNGNYKIFKGKKIYDEGKWELSKDGVFIILNPGTDSEFYFRIIEITESELKIAQTLVLIFDKKDNERGFVNFIVSMKN